MSAQLLVLLTIALIPLCGVMCAITPFLMPKDECFTVTIPESAQSDERLKALKRKYLIVMLVVTAVCTLLIAVLYPNCLEQSDSIMFSIVYTIATLIPVALSFVLMLVNRRRVQKIKQQEGWQATTQQAAAVISSAADIPEPINIRWNILYIPLFVVIAMATYLLYPLMPEQIPMQVDLAGNVTSSVAKTPITASFGLIVCIIIAACFIFCHWGIVNSKRVVNPQKAVSSAYSYGVFARSQSIIMLAFGLLLCAAIGLLIPLASVGVITILQAAVIILGISLMFVVVVFVVCLRYGQSGARIFKDGSGTDGMPRDDDKYWKLGVFYVNAQDPAVFVPKRFGFGWTLNFGRPKTWLIVIGFIVVLGAFIAACEAVF